jgi:hypothetical protein
LLNTVLATFSEGAPPIPPSSYESIATYNPVTGSSVTFSSIAGTYKSLQLRILGFALTANYFGLQFNGDTGANYTRHAIIGNGATVTAFGNTGRTYCQISSGSANPSITNGYGIIVDLVDYASSTKNKTVRASSGLDANGSGEMSLWSHLWVNTNAITSITVLTDGTYSTGNSIALYGIKG